MDKVTGKVKFKKARSSSAPGSAASASVQVVTPIDKVPAEVWGIIFDKLDDFQDCLNITEVCSFWRNVIHSSHSSWLFVMIFPHLLEYLSKIDILNCRAVCKQWCSGVDYFLENNAIQRPSSVDFTEEKHGAINEISRKGICNQHLQYILREKELIFHKFISAQKIQRFLERARTHPRCPVIGRSVQIMTAKPTGSLDVDVWEEPPNKQLLEAIGHHLWCMTIKVVNYPPVEGLKQIVDLMAHVPNLRKLEVEGGLEKEYDADVGNRIINTVEGGRLMTMYMDSEITAKWNQLQCNLESLKIASINGRNAQEFRESLLRMFINVKVTTLDLYVTHLPKDFVAPKLTDLALTVDSEEQLKTVYFVKSPLLKLNVILEKSVASEELMRAFCNFETSLVELDLNLRQGFYTPDEVHVIDRLGLCKAFTEVKIFDKFSNLRRVHITGYPPPSVNFLCGLKRNLEYLNFQMSSDGVQSLERILETDFVVTNKDKEVVDVLEYLKMYLIMNNNTLYKSNVWSFFPKLRVLTISVSTLSSGKREKEFRRDVYEKVQELS